MLAAILLLSIMRLRLRSPSFPLRTAAAAAAAAAPGMTANIAHAAAKCAASAQLTKNVDL